MKATFQRSYRKSGSANLVFVYALLNVTPAQKEEYMNNLGENYREDDKGNPLYFSTRYSGDNVTLIKTTNDRYVPDMSEFDKASSLASQYGGNFGTELAKAAAAKLVSGQSQAQPANRVTTPEVEEEQIDK